jgi:hypothetical protein
MLNVVKYLLISIVLIGLFGCTQGTGVQCQSPAIPMTDINGNTVCVMSTDDVITPTDSEEIPSEETDSTEEISENQDAMDNLDAETNEQEELIDDLTEIEDTNEEDNMVGDDRDEHGCIGSAGYTWCEAKQKCLREWEEPCKTVEEETTEVSATDEDTSAYPRKEVTAGEMVSFPNLQAVDPEGQTIEYTFSSPLDEKGEWQTTENDVGEYIVTIIASDGVNEIRQKVLIIVSGINHPPKINPMNQVTVTEGEKITLNPQVSDQDGDSLTITYSEPFDKDGEWKTAEGDAGEYQAEVTVSDGEFSSSTNVIIKVNVANTAPVLTIDNTLTVNEGETITLNPEVSDPDNDDVKVSYSGWMTSSSYTTTYEDAGEYTVIVIATDGTNEVTETVTITVIDKNQPPVFVPGAFE